MEIEPSKTGKMEEEGVEKGEMEEEKQEEKPAEKVEEPNFKIYDNFSRVLPKQEEYITFLQDSRYRPVLQVKLREIISLTLFRIERKVFCSL